MFIVLLIAVTAALVVTAAYFSVIGIASIFASSYIPALIMGGSLEAGKIATASYLYRYWGTTPKPLRIFLFVFFVLLMVVTSVGIFGFLTQGYQKTSEDMRRLNIELSMLEQELKDKRVRDRELNQHIESLPADFVTAKIRLNREFFSEQKILRTRIIELDQRIQDLRLKQVSFESHLGPITYFAKTVGVAQETVVLWAILLLVFIFDPLAISLTLACNILLLRRWAERERAAEEIDASVERYITEHREIVMDKPVVALASEKKFFRKGRRKPAAK